MFYLSTIKRAVIATSIGMLIAAASHAQTTQFTYQGRLTDSTVASPTNGTYEIRFRAFDAASGGNLLPTIVDLPTVQVVNGVFTVQLDLGSAGFNGQPIYLEIAARLAGSVNPLVVLNPRQQVTSAPYAIQSLNAAVANDSANLGGVPANQYVQTSDQRLSDSRNPLPGSQSYIQNGTSFQAFSNFNISGAGTANTLNASIISATSQYNFGASRFLSVGGLNNTIAGLGAGSVNSGTGNAFFGTNTGNANTSGGGNSFYGSSAGAANTNASFNSFFGSSAGVQNNTGDSNSFFGFAAGAKNTSGFNNTFFGTNAGNNNVTSTSNSFFGAGSGKQNTGGSNSFFGYSAGGVNTTGTHNSFFGESSGSANTTSSDNAFYGFNSGLNNTASGNAFFGSLSGKANSIGSGNSFYGASSGVANNTGSFNSFFGTNAGSGNLGGASNAFFGQNAGIANTSGSNNSFIGQVAGQSNTNGSANVFVGTAAGQALTTGTGNTFVGFQSGQNSTDASAMGLNTLLGYNTKVQCPTPQNGGCFTPITHSTAIGADAVVRYPNEIILGTTSDTVETEGDLHVGVGGAGNTLYTDNLFIGLSGGGNNAVCLINNPGILAFCSSSLRYKTNVASYSKGIDVIKRLMPITFDWKSDGMHDVGFGAEDVAKVDPLLVTYNKQGTVEGVKYDRISTALVNSVKEQQAQIDQQNAQIKIMQQQINSLKNLVVSRNKPIQRRSQKGRSRRATK